MLRVDIPGRRSLRLEHLVLDFNGTLAVDGKLLPGVSTRLRHLSRQMEIHILTADTFGRARSEVAGLPCELKILAARLQDRAKAAYVRRLGAARTVAIGNGLNDRLMLHAATLGPADIVVRAATDALELLLRPKRLVATLRN